MEPALYVMGGITVAVISGTVGKMIGGYRKVKDEICKERRESCLALVIEKIDNLENKIDGLIETVKNNGKAL